MSYFHGQSIESATVQTCAAASFRELCAWLEAHTSKFPFSQEQFDALPRRDKTADMDQDRLKRSPYLVASEFTQSPSPRRYEHAGKCNLLFLDIDDSKESARLLAQAWEDLLPGLAFAVWHTASSRPGAPRLRVMAAAAGIPRDRYPSAVRTLGEMLGLSEVTRESRVVVQPMFLPVEWPDEPFKWVACVPDGAPFTDGDIIPDGDSTLVEAPFTEQGMADLRFFSAPLEGVTLDEARGALACLDPDCTMQQWIEAGAALKHQFDDEEGFVLWHEWSAKGKKYDGEEEMRYRWGTLRATLLDRAPITLRTLLHRAMARGWENPALVSRLHTETLEWIGSTARSAEELLDLGAKRVAKVAQLVGTLQRQSLLLALKDRLARFDHKIGLPDLKRAVKDVEREALRRTGPPAWTKGLCFITSSNEFFRHTTGRSFTPEVLDLIYSIPSVGDDKAPRARDYAIHAATVPQVEATRYDPARKDRYFSEGHVPYLNIYRANHPSPDPETAGECGDVMLAHLGKLISNPAYVRTLVDYAAYLVQQPGRKIRWAPLVQSAQGAGKTAFGAMLGAVLGRGNSRKLGPDNILKRQYTDWATGTQLVIMEEVRIVGHNRHAVMDMLKPCITDDEVSIDRKWEDLKSVQNITNYLMFTNYSDALAIDDHDRRYFVVASSVQTREQVVALGGDGYFDKLYNLIRDHPGGFRAWLERWAIDPAFRPEGRAPLTEHLKEMARHAASPLSAAVRDAIADADHALVSGQLVSIQALRSQIMGAGVPPFSDQALAAVLRELGWEPRDRVRLGEERHRLWLPAGSKAHAPTLAETLMAL